jgi:hypothetical protein
LGKISFLEQNLFTRPVNTGVSGSPLKNLLTRSLDQENLLFPVNQRVPSLLVRAGRGFSGGQLALKFFANRKQDAKPCRFLYNHSSSDRNISRTT